MLQPQAQLKGDSDFPDFSMGAGIKGNLKKKKWEKDWQLERIP